MRPSTAGELQAWLGGRVVKWWLPERWAFVEEIPKTGVGKFDKMTLRARHHDDELDVIILDTTQK